MTPTASGSGRNRGGVNRPGMRMGSGQPDEALQALRRGLRLILGLLNPVTAIVAVVLVVMTARTDAVRSRAGWVALLGALGTGVALFTQQLVGYLRPWRELLTAARHTVETSTSARPDRDQGIGTAIAERWPEWILAQLPLAMPAAVLVLGIVLLRRRRFAAHWRPPADTPATSKDVEKALRRLSRPTVATSREKPAETAHDLSVVIGVNVESAQPVRLPAEALRMHMVVTGPTGFGKSTTIMRITDQLLASPAAVGLRLPHVFIDMKGDPEMVAFLRTLAESTGRTFHCVTVDGATSARYNPLAAGSAGEMKNKLIECEANAADGGFSEPHHRRVAERYLLLACEVLQDLVVSGALLQDGRERRPWRRDLGDLVRLLKPAEIGRNVDRLSPTNQGRVTEYLSELNDDKDLAKSISGIRQRFALMSEETGAILTETPDGIDLHAAILAGDVVLFSLDAMRNAAVARHLGNLALQDLTHVFARLQDERYRASGKLVWVVVDEFSALGGSLMLNLFSRARGAGGALALASQDFADLRAVSEAFEAAVTTNANIGIFHRQKGKSASDRAEAFGTYQQWDETTQVQEDNSILGAVSIASGVGSLRMVDKFRIHPNDLKNLPRGVAVVAVDHPDNTLTKVAIAPPSPQVISPRQAAPTPPASPPHSPPVAPVAAPNSASRPLDAEDDWLTAQVDDDEG